MFPFPPPPNFSLNMPYLCHGCFSVLLPMLFFGGLRPAFPARSLRFSPPLTCKRRQSPCLPHPHLSPSLVGWQRFGFVVSSSLVVSFPFSIFTFFSLRLIRGGPHDDGDLFLITEMAFSTPPSDSAGLSHATLSPFCKQPFRYRPVSLRRVWEYLLLLQPNRAPRSYN